MFYKQIISISQTNSPKIWHIYQTFESTKARLVFDNWGRGSSPDTSELLNSPVSCRIMARYMEIFPPRGITNGGECIRLVKIATFVVSCHFLIICIQIIFMKLQALQTSVPTNNIHIMILMFLIHP